MKAYLMVIMGVLLFFGADREALGGAEADRPELSVTGVAQDPGGRLFAIVKKVGMVRVGQHFEIRKGEWVWDVRTASVDLREGPRFTWKLMVQPDSAPVGVSPHVAAPVAAPEIKRRGSGLRDPFGPMLLKED